MKLNEHMCPMPILLAAAVLGFVLLAHDSPTLNGATGYPVTPKLLGDIVRASVAAVNERGIEVTTEMKLRFEIHSPCNDPAITGDCFVVDIARDHAPPRMTHEVAHLIGQKTATGPKILDVSTFGAKSDA